VVCETTNSLIIELAFLSVFSKYWIKGAPVIYEGPTLSFGCYDAISALEINSAAVSLAETNNFFKSRHFVRIVRLQ
jgi:hypothetical protein